MKQADLKIGTVYVGKCGKRFRLFERIDILGRARCLCAKRYADGKLLIDGSCFSVAISPLALARWADREATAEESDAVCLALRLGNAGGVG